MAVDRRSVLKVIAAAGAATVAGPAGARERPKPPEDAVGMLYDATRCIGCKSCVVACREANGMPVEELEGMWDAPISLSGKTKNIIKLYREGDTTSYMKAQCMHCIDPACVSVCMIGALQKRERGIVTWDPSRCIGCRYCQVACPFDVPKFEWEKAVPQIVKCELCRHRLDEGKEPACCEVCPTEAVVYGSYDKLLAEARRRLEADPERYYPKIYGEHDGGGTQVLYLTAAGVPFEKLGLPDLGDEPVPELSETIQHGIYQGFIAPAALFVALGAVIWRNRRSHPEEGEAEEETS